MAKRSIKTVATFWATFGKTWATFGKTWATLEKLGQLLEKLGQLLEKLGLLFIPTSGQPGVIESPTKYSHSSSSIRYILKTQKQSI